MTTYARLTTGTHDDPQQAVRDMVVIESDLEGGGAAWDDITGKPSTFTPTIGATATTAVAGNDTRLTAGAAGTATVRAIGTTATTAAAGSHVHTATQVTATAIGPGTATTVQGILAELAARIATLETT